MEHKILSKDDIYKAKCVDPFHFFESKGYAVKKEGRHYSIKNGDEEIFRTTKFDDGRFVTCDKYGNGIGDNIELVKRLENCDFYSAVNKLNRNIYQKISNNYIYKNDGEINEKIKLPYYTFNDVKNGRDYLQNRGIDLNITLKLEKESLIRYAEGSVLFIGYDSEKNIKNVTRRAINGNDAIQKRDFKGSDKFYPQILQGSEKNVWIVEGGIDGLALHTMANRMGKTPPTVIVTGGANVLSPFDNPRVIGLLKKSEHIIIAQENEESLQTQMKTNGAHQKQLDKVLQQTGKTPVLWKPPAAKGKDVAEYNIYIKRNWKPDREALSSSDPSIMPQAHRVQVRHVFRL